MPFKSYEIKEECKRIVKDADAQGKLKVFVYFNIRKGDTVTPACALGHIMDNLGGGDVSRARLRETLGLTDTEQKAIENANDAKSHDLIEARPELSRVLNSEDMETMHGDAEAVLEVIEKIPVK